MIRKTLIALTAALLLAALPLAADQVSSRRAERPAVDDERSVMDQFRRYCQHRSAEAQVNFCHMAFGP
jgi:hypothetical protein